MSSKVAENMSTYAKQAQTNLLPNNATVATSNDVGQSKTHLFLNEIIDGVTRTIIVMVCRIWDVHAVTGRYLSMDFVVSDAQGDAIHCTAKVNIAHNFLKLKEGLVYSIKDFVVQGNQDEYRIFRDHAFILEFDGATSLRIASGKDGGFRPVNPNDAVGRPQRCVDRKENEQCRPVSGRSDIHECKTLQYEGEGSLNQV
ncbi:zinc finger, CCHC-type containing protein, partial [Tanacetum coccineum]